MTRQREVGEVILSSMLPGCYVFDVMRELAIALRKSTVFAAMPGPLPDESAARRIHLQLRT